MWKADVSGVKEVRFADDKERKHGAASRNSTCSTKASGTLLTAEAGTNQPTSSLSQPLLMS